MARARLSHRLGIEARAARNTRHRVRMSDAPYASTAKVHDLLYEAVGASRGAFTRAGLTVELAASPYPDRDRYIGVLEA